MLTRARGEIDCGGLRFLIVGYGNLYQLVLPIPEGHLSIAFEPTADPVLYIPRMLRLLKKHGLETVPDRSRAEGDERK